MKTLNRKVFGTNGPTRVKLGSKRGQIEVKTRVVRRGVRKIFEDFRFSVRFHGNLFLDRLKMTSLKLRFDLFRREAHPTLISKMKWVFLQTTLKRYWS